MVAVSSFSSAQMTATDHGWWMNVSPLLRTWPACLSQA